MDASVTSVLVEDLGETIETLDQEIRVAKAEADAHRLVNLERVRTRLTGIRLTIQAESEEDVLGAYKDEDDMAKTLCEECAYETGEMTEPLDEPAFLDACEWCDKTRQELKEEN